MKINKLFSNIKYILFHDIDFTFFPYMISQFLNGFILLNCFFIIFILIDNTAFLPLIYNPMYLSFLNIAFQFFIITCFVSLALDVVKSFMYD